MSERLSPPETCKIPGAAMIKLSQWYSGERIIPIDYEQLNKPQHVVTLPHGIRTKTDFSIAAFFGDNSVYAWWERDRKGFLQALKQDRDLKLSLEAVDDLIERLANPPTKDYDIKVTTLALTEMLAQVSQTAEPHIPKYIVEHEEKEAIDEDIYFQAESSDQTERTTEHLPDKGADIFPKLTIPKSLQKLRGFFHVSLSPTQDSPYSPATSHPRNAHPARSQSSSRADTDTQSPLLNTHEDVGRDRAWKDFKGRKRMVDFINEGISDYNQPFIVTHIYTAYDPESGTLFDNASQDKHPVLDQWSYGSSSGQIIRMPLGQLLFGQQEIRIPWPMHVAPNARADSRNGKGRLSKVALHTNKSELLTINQYNDALLKDNVGNVSLSIPLLPPEVKEQIWKDPMVLEVKYDIWGDFYYNSNKLAFMKGYTPEELPPTYLYPPVIQEYLEVLLDKKQRRVPGYEDNGKIFSDLANFLGNYWLTYSRLDAKPTNADPSAAQQTERVLRGRIASCEGANIMLGQLMRYFLEEGEGIAYVTGYILDEDEDPSKRSANEGNYHVKVMLLDDSGIGYSIYDATPWDKEAHALFHDSAKKYKVAKSEWLNKKNDVLRRFGLSKKDLRNIRKRAESTWADVSYTWISKNHGNYDYDAFQQEGIWLGYLPGWVDESDKAKLITSSDNSDPGLRKFLLSEHSVGKTLEDHFPFTYVPINGVMDFSFKFPHSNPHTRVAQTNAPRTLLFGRGETERILSFPGFREKVFNTTSTIFSEGLAATQQNIDVITQFTGLVYRIKQDYEERIKAILVQAQEGSFVDGVDEFFDGAPFLMLLDNPLNSLPDFFTRSDAQKTRGFLSPSDSEAMAEKMDKMLKDWHVSMQQRLEQIAELMQNAPKTLAKPAVEVTFPSLRFWPEDVKPQEEPDADESVPEYLDPTDTFIYLCKELFPPKEGLEEIQQEF